MIRTSLTMSISQDDAKTKTFLVNGAHLGLLSPASQNIHVQTNHKPQQLIIAFSIAETGHESESMDNHRRQIEIWQAFTSLLSKRGCSELHALLNQFNLTPDLLMCLTEQRLQAWIPQRMSLFLLRDNEFRRIKPVQPRDVETVERLTENLSYYSVSLQIDDHYLMLPPDLTNYFASGEIAGLLSGLRQLPAKMSDLFNSARLRGYTQEGSWLAWQILRLEADLKPPADDVTWIRNIKNLLAARATIKATELDEESDSEYLSREEQEVKTAQIKANKQSLKRQKIILAAAVLIFMAALVFAGIALAGRLGREIEETTETEETTVRETTRRPTPSPTLTPTPEPTTTERVFHYYVRVRRLNLRTEPNQRSELLYTLSSDDRLEKLAEPDDGWVMVRTEDGLEGFVYFDYVDELEPEPETDSDV